MNAADEIRETKNVLFERGWYQGGPEGPNGEVCLEGAYNVACGRSASAWEQGEGYEAIRSAVADYGPIPFVFNDWPSTTFDDVIDLLDKAEKIAEAMS